MQQRLSLVTLAVADVARSRTFYEKGLGWKPSFTQDDIAFYQLPGMVFGLWSRKAFAADMGMTEKQLGPGGIGLAHNVKDAKEVDRLLVEAKKAGAKIVKPAHKAVWGGYTGTFADPDGHLWEVAWNPTWNLAADGTVRL